LSLDLGDTAPAEALSQSSQAAAEDPLATKLALAQEFAAIGDSDGARTLIEEVIEESQGELKERAQRLLSEID
ncbi:MAG: FimV/HubP family polar landmark protein, partial [Comamonas sp.]